MTELVYNDRVATYTDENINQSVSFEYPDGTFFVAISGGLDSTVLINLICKYITDLKLEDKIQIVPIHSVSKQLSNSLEPTELILIDVIKKYPNVHILDLEVYFYDEEYMDKFHAMHSFYKELFEKYNDAKLVTNALSALPKEVFSWPVGINQIAMRRAKKLNEQNFYRNNIHLYRPFAKNDKKLTASLFKYLNLPKKYITETWSCTFYGDKTENFTKPCGKCYHCWEKRWAFGQF